LNNTVPRDAQRQFLQRGLIEGFPRLIRVRGDLVDGEILKRGALSDGWQQ